PASSAAQAISTCEAGGVAMETRSTSVSRTSSRQSRYRARFGASTCCASSDTATISTASSSLQHLCRNRPNPPNPMTPTRNRSNASTPEAIPRARLVPLGSGREQLLSFSQMLPDDLLLQFHPQSGRLGHLHEAVLHDRFLDAG